jgi:hypothetical protein
MGQGELAFAYNTRSIHARQHALFAQTANRVGCPSSHFLGLGLENVADLLEHIHKALLGEAREAGFSSPEVESERKAEIERRQLEGHTLARE